VGLSTTAIFAGYFFGNFKDKASIMQSLVGFSVIPKCMTLNDLEWLFRVKFCCRAGSAVCLPSDRATFENNNCVKTNKGRSILSAASGAQIFGRDFSFWQCKVSTGIRESSLERERHMKIWFWYSKWTFSISIWISSISRKL